MIQSDTNLYVSLIDEKKKYIKGLICLEDFMVNLTVIWIIFGSRWNKKEDKQK